MESFFGGTVIILYFLSHYAAEPIFVLCCCLPALFGAVSMLFLRLGGTGAMLSAWRRARPFRHNGVVAGGERALFYKRCIKRTTPAYRAAYDLFLQGKLSAAELSAIGIESAKRHRGSVAFCSICVGAFAALSVFLTFYFLVPIGETLLRTVVCAFHGTVSAISLHILSIAYVARAEKAAARFTSRLDGLLLRPKKDVCFDPLLRVEDPKTTPAPLQGAKAEKKQKEDPDLVALKAMLRELDAPASR